MADGDGEAVFSSLLEIYFFFGVCGVDGEMVLSTNTIPHGCNSGSVMTEYNGN